MTHPRPDFTRPNLPWTSLNGPWSFLFDDDNEGLISNWSSSGLPTKTSKHSLRQIRVPFAFQTEASGINLQEAHEIIWYEREIKDVRPTTRSGERLLLRFGAVDYESTIWVNGREYASHRGGYVPFDVDISDAFPPDTKEQTARVTLRVRDSPTDLTQPRGKQYWGPVPESIFYTPTSGIWQNVWLEGVLGVRIGDASAGTVLKGNDIESGKVTGSVALVGFDSVGEGEVRVRTALGGVGVGDTTVKVSPGSTSAPIEVGVRVSDTEAVNKNLPGLVWHNGVALWAPEHPTLYDVSITLLISGKTVDEINTTLGMRSITWTTGDSTFRLNGKPYFQTLCLDQGYWPSTGLTPPSSEALKEDIILSKKVGLNGCRKHQKVEDPAFLYWADRLGYLVWGEIGNAYEFSEEYVERFNEEWAAVVKRDRNHACVVAWTPVNESWGYKNLKDNVREREHIRVLNNLTKSLDPTRPINDNCGWESVLTDLTTYHDYADSSELAGTCSNLETGILGRKLNGEMFLSPITSPDGKVLDPGSKHTPGAPIICSEFGGVNIAPAKDGKTKPATDRDWGYTTAADPEDLLDRLEKLFMAVVRGGYTCGFVYTQLTDIEQEVNGIYAYDRREKVPAARVKTLMDAARDYYYENVAPRA